jgi:hypothetical protein
MHAPSGRRSDCNAKSERLDFTQFDYRDHRPCCADGFMNTVAGVIGDRTLEFGTMWKTVTLAPLFDEKSGPPADFAHLCF